MKIVHISHLYHPSPGGVQFFFKNVSERLVKDYGDEVTVVTTNSWFGPERRNFKEIAPAEEVINGVKVLRFPYKRTHIRLYAVVYKVLGKLAIRKPESMVLKSNGPYSKQMKKYLMQVQADAFCGSSSNYYFMQLPLWRRCNFFYYGSIHLAEDKQKTSLLAAQVRSMNASTLYLANTGYERERLAGLGVQLEKIFVLGTGVDMEPFTAVTTAEIAIFKKELDLPPDALVIGYAGRIEKTKNVLLLIRAFTKVAAKFDNVHLLLAGSGSEYAGELKAACNALDAGILKRIRWQVNFAPEKKALVFNSMDLLVLPSHNESFGLVFLEAWSCKKPVIGAAIGAVKDVIQDGVDGLIMDIDNEESLVEKLTKLITDPALRTTMGENGFRKVKDQFTWDIIVSRLRKCYQEAGVCNN